MRVTPFTQPVCAVGANSGGLAAPKKRSQHDHECERGTGLILKKEAEYGGTDVGK